jgi:ribosomal protein S18 acetylase RimI-like enzyme
MLHRTETQGAVLVAESNGTFAGFVAGWIEETENVGETPDSNRVGYISDICVMPDFRGRRLATRLLSRIEQHLGRAGVTRLRINSLAANQSARTSFEHAGFFPMKSSTKRRLSLKMGHETRAAGLCATAKPISR